MSGGHKLLRMALVHLIVSGLVLWLGYYWLGIAETRGSTLTWSFCVSLLILPLTCAVFGAGLVFFHDAEPGGVAGALRTSIRNLLPLAVAAIGIVVVYWLLTRWGDYSAKPAFRIASWLTLKLRKPVRPGSVAHVFAVVLWLVRWMVVPVLAMPVVAGIANEGWRGLGAVAVKTRKGVYWIAVPAVLFCEVKLPLLLLQWVPHVSGFRMQAVSFVLRGTAAYLLFGCGWLVLAAMTSGGKPRLTQPSTTVSP